MLTEESKPYISIVTPLYLSSTYIGEFYSRISASLQRIKASSYEIVFVDDGSPDSSAKIAKDICDRDSSVRLILLSRNFGHHPAIFAGLTYARADLIYVTDVDLEEPPELLEAFHKKLEANSNVDCVFGYYSKNGRPWVSALCSAAFYRVINYLSDTQIPQNLIMARLMRRNYLNAALRFHESHIFLGGIMHSIGFNTLGIETTKTFKGSSTYTYSKRISSAADAILSFSSKPLLIIFNAGISIAGLSIASAFALVVKTLFFEWSAPGWASIMVSIWFLGGVTIASVGIVGLYVGKVFIQSKNRPRWHIREIYQLSTDHLRPRQNIPIKDQGSLNDKK